MTITNKHVGWGIVILLLLAPWVPVWFFGVEAFPDCGPDCTTGGGLLRVIDLCIIGLGLLGAIFWWVADLINGYRYFEWCIPIDKWFGRKKLSKDHTRELFLKLHELPQDSKEWETVYNELDKKGQWG